MATVSTFAGKPLFGEVRWVLRGGARPFMARINLTKPDAEDVLNGGFKPHELKIACEGNELRVKDLWVIQQAPADAPAWKSVLVADRRHLWGYVLFRGVFNLRRNVGVKRLTNSAIALEAQLLVPTVQYAPFSLKNQTKPWEPEDLLEALLKMASDAEQRAGGPGFGWAIDVFKAAPIENLELDGSVADCLEQVLAYLPGAGLALDPDGRVRIYRKHAGGEGDVLHHMGPEVIDGGHIEPCDLSFLRPRETHVFFTVRSEVRLDAEEAATIGDTSQPDPDGRTMTNVLPLPDFTTTMSDGTVLDLGTWCAFDRALFAWGGVPYVDKSGAVQTGSGKLDYPLIRKAFMPGLDLWGPLGIAGALDPNANWRGRIAAVMSHYRQTFRINPRWMDRFWRIFPTRVALADVVTGTRAPMGVWTDYSYTATQRSILLERLGSADSGHYAINHQGYPTDGLLASVETSAAVRGSIVDPDQGIIGLEYLVDRNRVYEAALPGQVELEGENTQPGHAPASGGPSAALGSNTVGISFNALRAGDRLPTLTASHKVAVVLSAIPGSPNGKGSLVRIVVKPTDPGIPDFPGKDRCLGPVHEYHVGAGLECALVAWKDDRSEDIERLFGLPHTDDLAAAAPESIKDLIVNLDEADPSTATGASLKKLAVAAAARIWTSLRDRPQGSATYGFRPGARLEGWADSVTHQIDGTEGVVTTSLDLPATLSPLRIDQYLDASTRRVLYHLADQARDR